MTTCKLKHMCHVHALCVPHMARDWAKSTPPAKPLHEPLWPSAQLSTTGFSAWPADPCSSFCHNGQVQNSPKTDWGCPIRDTWWHQRLELAHSPFARVRQAFGTYFFFFFFFVHGLFIYSTSVLLLPHHLLEFHGSSPGVMTPPIHLIVIIITDTYIQVTWAVVNSVQPSPYWLVLPSSTLTIIQQSPLMILS